MSDNVFEVLFINTSGRFAVIKVSRSIRNLIVKRGRIYLGMQSLSANDHFQPLQCYSCQTHGHTAASPHCKNTGAERTCLYCCGNHFSKDCRVKKDRGKHLCANCSSSDNARYKNNSCHTSTSLSCPFVLREINALIRKTSWPSRR